MAKKTIANLAVVLSAENVKLKSKLDQSQRQIKNFRKKAKVQLSGLSTDFKAAFAFIGGAQLARGLVGTLREFSVLDSQLKTATGSAVAAGDAMQRLEKFAAETPFALEQSVDAFVRLKNLGLDPSIEALRSYGNTASAMGRDLNQMIEAVADATVGEFERLKEFGIKAKSEGDKVSFTFRGVSTTIQKEASAIEGYLRDLGDVEFGGAMEERAESLDGALSNLGDSFKGLARSIGEAGLNTLLKETARNISAVANAIPQLPDVFSGLGKTTEQVKTMEEINSRIVSVKRQLRATENSENRAYLENELKLLYEKQKILTETNVQLRVENSLQTQDENEAFGPFDPPGAIAALQGPSKEETRAATKALAAAQRELNRILKEGKDLTTDLYTPQEKYASQIERLNFLIQKGAIDQQTYNRAVAKYQDELDDATGVTQQFADLQEAIAESDPSGVLFKEIEALEQLAAAYPQFADHITEVIFNRQEAIDALFEDVEEKADDAKTAWEKLGPTFASAFEDAVVEGAKLSDILKGLEKDIIRIITRTAITEPLGNFLGESLKGTGSGFNLGGLFGFANGGDFTVGGSGGTDSQVVAFKATPGEEVSIRTPQQAAGGMVINNSFVLPADTVDYRKTGSQVAREASRMIGMARGAV